VTAASRTDTIWASLTGVAALGLFIATLQPGFGGPEDTPKFQFLGYVLGTAHPPGYPLYVLLSNLFVRLPIRTIAYRANLFSAVTAALACALVYVIARQLGSRRWPASGAALGLATGASFWLSAVYAEVYGLAALMAALTIALFLDWRARGGSARLLLAVAAFSAGMGNHLTLIGIVPACLLYVALRDRRVLTPRLVAAAAGLLLLGAAQYGLIILRTHQRAPYLESEAHSVSELVAVVTAQRFAEKRFAFTAAQLLTDHLPAMLRVIGRELGIAGVAFLALGCVAAVRTQSAPAAVLAGAGAGMFAMVLNLQGDLKGFITPVMVFVWPFAAVGVTACAEWLAGWRVERRVAAAIVLAGAAIMPAANVMANYRDADRSRDTDAAQFHAAMFAQLPDRAAFVIEDYASNMALCYYLFTGEAGPSRGIERVGLGGVQVRERGRTHPVFAFARAAAVLQAEGLRFERWDVTGPPLDDWLGALPAGALIAGATSYVAAPFDLSRIGHASARPTGRPHAFEAFAFVSHRVGSAWREDDQAATLTIDRAALGAPLPAVSQPLLASASGRDARVELGGETIARVDAGRALGVFASDGTLLRAVEIAAGAPLRVPFPELVYELKGQNPCVDLSTEGWTDVAPVFSTGSWVATLGQIGSVEVETAIDGPSDIRVDGRELLTNGVVHLDGPTRNADGSETIVTQLTRTDGLRPVFRLAVDRLPVSARARVKPGGVSTSVTLCPDTPLNPLFRGGGNHAVLRPDFESESYFGAGWSGVDRTPNGRVRHGSSGAALLLPLEAAFSYRLSLDIGAVEPAAINVVANDAAAGTCEVRDRAPCEIDLPATAIRDGVNVVTLSVRPPRGNGAILTLHGARLERRRPD